MITRTKFFFSLLIFNFGDYVIRGICYSGTLTFVDYFSGIMSPGILNRGLCLPEDKIPEDKIPEDVISERQNPRRQIPRF